MYYTFRCKNKCDHLTCLYVLNMSKQKKKFEAFKSEFVYLACPNRFLKKDWHVDVGHVRHKPSASIDQRNLHKQNIY